MYIVSSDRGGLWYASTRKSNALHEALKAATYLSTASKITIKRAGVVVVTLERTETGWSLQKVEKRYFLRVGSVSEGTMRPEDLLWTFADELADLRLTRKQRQQLHQIVTRASHDQDGSYFDESEESSWDMEMLFDMLNDHCPDYTYFGSHPGDGAAYGCWPSLDDFDGLTVSDTSEVPASYIGHVLHTNDHGNQTLYAANRGRLREIWATV